LHRFTARLPDEPAGYLAPLRRALGPTLGSEAALAHVRGHYDGTLAWFDTGLVRILDGLDRGGLAARTVVLFTSNHGQELGEHGGVGHQGVHWEEVVRVPLLVRDPAGASGVHVADMVEGVDLAPTLLERAGVPLPARLDGRSLLPLLRDPDAGRPARDVLTTSSFGIGSLRAGPWKLAIHAGNCPPAPGRDLPDCVELYDLGADPAEAHDLSETEPQRRAEMEARLRAWMGHQGDGPPRVDPALEKALRDGGYWGLVDGRAAPPEPKDTPEERRARREAARRERPGR
jgi:arylsulfatase A-like enzyme